MKLFSAVLLTVLAAKAVVAQDYPLQTRPKPLAAVLVGVCENRQHVLMVAVFTYSDGHVLVVNGKSMQGFKDAAEIVHYAASASQITDMAQTCGDVAT